MIKTDEHSRVTDVHFGTGILISYIENVADEHVLIMSGASAGYQVRPDETPEESGSIVRLHFPNLRSIDSFSQSIRNFRDTVVRTTPIDK